MTSTPNAHLFLRKHVSGPPSRKDRHCRSKFPNPVPEVPRLVDLFRPPPHPTPLVPSLVPLTDRTPLSTLKLRHSVPFGNLHLPQDRHPHRSPRTPSLPHRTPTPPPLSRFDAPRRVHLDYPSEYLPPPSLTVNLLRSSRKTRVSALGRRERRVVVPSCPTPFARKPNATSPSRGPRSSLVWSRGILSVVP